ncbi:restriction endonuclease subunit S [Staphylococcus pseudoxylosus]|uniref:restriction endonuclease subunit S n=1 Tax=Staphylococcus pseudoxylosus TaxID=2282419 RepID=UPI002DB58996|nr:restriction endonuclease subunit S [Staphylococcus pseudoxylosus]MEB6331807.1 restriction endonuclease subunit S [Staphylococcus pseudoxylosus]
MEFKEYYLGELCEIKSSKRIYAKDYVNKGIPFYRSKEIIEKSKGLDISQNLYIDNKKFEEIEEKHGIPETGDLLLTSVGTLGVPYIVKNEKFYFKDGNLTWFTNFKSLLNQYYLFYWFKSKEGIGEINRVTIGSTQKALTIKNLRYLKITLPDKKNQFKIINLIQKIENKLENNKQVIANLEELSQTLFKRWFVDFEFPDENGNPYKSSGGEMVDSELGKIPKYWKVSNLDKIASFVSRGITPKYNENSDIQIPIINQKVNKGPRLDLQYIKYFDGQNRIKKELYAQKNDLLLNSLGQGTLGRIHLFTRKSEVFLIDQHISIIRFDNINYSYFYYAHINTELIQGQIDSLISGSTGMLMLNITKIRNLKVILPTEELVLKYSKLVNEYFGKITQLIYENENLTQLRNTLLPKLMSGELEIPDDIEVNEDELSI